MAIILQRQEAVAGPQGSFPALTEKCLVKKMYPLFLSAYILVFCQYFFTFFLVLNMISPDMFDVIYPEPMEILGNLKY